MIRFFAFALMLLAPGAVLAQMPVWPRVERLPDSGEAPGVGNSGVTPPVRPNLGPRPVQPVAPRADESAPELGPTVSPRGPAPPRDPWVRRPLPALVLADPWPQDMHVHELPVPSVSGTRAPGQLRLP